MKSIRRRKGRRVDMWVTTSSKGEPKSKSQSRKERLRGKRRRRRRRKKKKSDVGKEGICRFLCALLCLPLPLAFSFSNILRLLLFRPFLITIFLYYFPAVGIPFFLNFFGGLFSRPFFFFPSIYRYNYYYYFF